MNKRASKFAMVFRTKTGMDPSRVSRPPDEERASDSPVKSNICQQRDCEFCGELIPAFDYPEHLREQCPQNPAYRTCKRCDLRITRRQYDQHIASNSCRSVAEIAKSQASEQRLEQARRNKRAAKFIFVECGSSEIGSVSFQEVFDIASRAYTRRFQIERDSQGDSFDADLFWLDDKLAQEMISAMTRSAKLKPGTNEPLLRKGKPVFVRSGVSSRSVAVAISIVRKGVRSVRALQALCRKSNSIANAIKQADELGSILRMISTLAASGLCANNREANKAKNAAIEGWENGGKVPAINARAALIGSLYGSPVTLAQVELIEAALYAWQHARHKSKKHQAQLSFDVIFGASDVLSPKVQRSNSAAPKNGTTENSPRRNHQDRKLV